MADSNLVRRGEFKDIVALVVEDNELLRKLVANVLSDLGIEDVSFVRTEEDGLHAFVERAAHIVIVEFGREYQGNRPGNPPYLTMSISAIVPA